MVLNTYKEILFPHSLLMQRLQAGPRLHFTYVHVVCFTNAVYIHVYILFVYRTIYIMYLKSI